MVRFRLTDYQLNSVNQYLKLNLDIENMLLEKYNSFLVEELPAAEYNNIVDDIQDFIAKNPKK